MKTATQTPRSKVNAHKAAILEMLATVTAEIEAYGVGEDVHWGHVGSLEMYRDRIKDVHDSLTHQGEYAPEAN